MFKKLSIAAVGLASAFAFTNASADGILVFGQVGLDNNFTATRSGGTTTLDANSILINITAIQGGAGGAAYFSLDATNTSDAVLELGDITQSFAGTFCITSGMGCTGTNFLTGSFVDSVFGSGTGLTLTASSASAGEVVNFTSDVITTLGGPRGMSLSFTNVTPPAAICGTGTDATLCAFTSNISGNFSAFRAVPEPGSLALLGIGLAGLGFAGRRRKQ